MTERAQKIRDFLILRGFLPVTEGSGAVFRSFQYDCVLMDLNATMVTSWGIEFNCVYKIIRNCLCNVWFCDENPFYGGLPLYFALHRSGEIPKDSLRQIIDVLYGISREADVPQLAIGSIDQGLLEDFQSVTGYTVKTEYSEDHSEYVYRTADVLELAGGINLNKRNRIKKFLNKPMVVLDPVTKDNLHLCLEIERQWCRGRDCGYCQSFAGCEKKALEHMKEIFTGTIHRGFIGFIDGLPAGFTICEKISDKSASLFFGKSTVNDFFVYLIYMSVKHFFSDVFYFNINEDMGNSGLRIFKKHLGAHRMWRKYLCIFTRTGSVYGP
ncbi:MAG: phosphatidylglycerol lysyltransferase domain-containing protein [Spirochaetaceae bacterium]|nr:phosphatidylglycerol lysyltransferase domain-containing protein [Spirochaetaceae bacterium]